MPLQKLAETLSIPKDNLAIEELVDQKFMFILDNFDVNCEDQKRILRVITKFKLQSIFNFKKIGCLMILLIHGRYATLVTCLYWK